MQCLVCSSIRLLCQNFSGILWPIYELTLCGYYVSIFVLLICRHLYLSLWLMVFVLNLWMQLLFFSKQNHIDLLVYQCGKTKTKGVHSYKRVQLYYHIYAMKDVNCPFECGYVIYDHSPNTSSSIIYSKQWYTNWWHHGFPE